jgi:hypothetical protein
LASLDGKRIGIVSDAQWQAHRMLPVIKTMLEEDFPGMFDCLLADAECNRHAGQDV